VLLLSVMVPNVGVRLDVLIDSVRLLDHVRVALSVELSEADADEGNEKEDDAVMLGEIEPETLTVRVGDSSELSVTERERDDSRVTDMVSVTLASRVIDLEREYSSLKLSVIESVMVSSSVVDRVTSCEDVAVTDRCGVEDWEAVRDAVAVVSGVWEWECSSDSEGPVRE